MYDYSKLHGRIVEVCGTKAEFARRMDLSERSVSLKLNNERGWKQAEMLKAAEVLNFPISKIKQYFFTLKAQ